MYRHFTPIPETLEELKSMYRKLAQQHHPDRGGDTATMQRINDEYSKLFPQLKDIHKKNASNELKTVFMGWLASAYSGGFEFATDDDHYTIIRVRKNEDFDYLYAQQQCSENGIERNENFKYTGIYCKLDGLLYDGRHAIRELIGDEAQSSKVLREQLKLAVCRAVEGKIGNDRQTLQISELSTERKRKDLAYYLECAAAEDARKAYLEDTYNADDGFSFRCDYEPDHWTEDSLLNYILNPVQYVEAEAGVYISSHQENMLMKFLCADAFAVEYAAILENTLAPVHRVKQIMSAVSASPAKTVTVTICKDEIEFTFKTEAQEFRWDCTSTYSNWRIAATDRREFERLFGRSSYRPEDILRITYARSVLYQA